jgi:pantothenate kinase type III
MILTIDFGNSRVKVGVFHQQQMVYHAAFDKFTLAEVKKIFNLFDDIEKCIISNVVDVSAPLINLFHQKLH